MNDHEFYDMTRAEQMKDWYRKVNLAYSLGKERWFIKHDASAGVGWYVVHLGVSPLSLHQTMFTIAIQKMMSKEQSAKWLPLAEKLAITGCYAQTEIGHGSDVSQLQTTATYEKETDEFVIHTPTPKATKWWPGDLGLHSTHAIVFARLIIEGNAYGVVPFIVQLRSTETFMPEKGIELGDMGPKLGYASKNNGWATFNQVRIPRENMLSKYVSVDKEGTFSI